MAEGYDKKEARERAIARSYSSLICPCCKGGMLEDEEGTCKQCTSFFRNVSWLSPRYAMQIQRFIGTRAFCIADFQRMKGWSSSETAKKELRRLYRAGVITFHERLGNRVHVFLLSEAWYSDI